MTPNEGEGKLLFLDAFSGVAGDMVVAALVDLGVPFQIVTDAVGCLGLRGVTLRMDRVSVGAIGASGFRVTVRGKQSERRHADIDRLIQRSPLEDGVKTRARAIFRRLAEAEAEVHRVAVEDVHFHEVGAADAIADIVGSAACFAYLGATVVCSPLPLGRGFVKSRHGILPLPAPATVGCLRGVPTVAAGVEAELVTPTGAAIVATLADRFESWPAFAPERIGWGAGTAALPDRPNALRAVLGTVAADGPAGATHVVLEANVDDMTGELAAHALGALMAAGALDAWATPCTMKKGRPGIVLSVLAQAGESAHLAGVLLGETTSIGVRSVPVSRVERPRRTVRVSTRFGEIPVKVSGGAFGPALAKPEFDACAEAALRAGVPVRVVLEEALFAARSIRAL